MVQQDSISSITMKHPIIYYGLIGYPSLLSHNNRRKASHEIHHDDELVHSHHQKKTKCQKSSSNDMMYRVVVDVPGINASDITISMEHNDTILHIIGGNSKDKNMCDADEEMIIHNKIIVDNRYTINPNIVNIDQLTALLMDNVLYISAPYLLENNNTAF